MREARARINRPKQDWEPPLVEIRYADRHARTGPVIGLTLPEVVIGSCPERRAESTKWNTDVWLEFRGLLWKLPPRNRDMPENLPEGAAPALPLQRLQVSKKSAAPNFYVLGLDTAKCSTTPVCTVSTFVSRGFSRRFGVQHSDECRLRTMEALEADDVRRRGMFLERNAPSRPATNAALTVLERPAPPVTATYTVRGFSSSSTGGSQIPSGRSARGSRSPTMETGDDENAQHTRRQSSDLPPLEADAPK